MRSPSPWARSTIPRATSTRLAQSSFGPMTLGHQAPSPRVLKCRT